MREKLINICTPRQWKTLSTSELKDEGYTVYGANGVIGYYNEYNHEAETVMVTCRGATCGTVNISKPHSYINGNAMCMDNLRHDIDVKYLYYALKNYDFREVISGSAQPQITRQGLNNVFVDVVDKPKQVEIVKILSNVEETINRKEQQLSEYDQLIKSRFVEMFGNLIDTVRLGDCCKVHARIGWQALTTAEHMQTGDYLLITGTDFKDNEVNYSTCKYVAKERYEMDDKIIIRNDDILITKDGTIGKVAIVHNLPKPATLNSGIFVVRPDQRFNKEYISYVFRGPLFDEFVEKTKTGATIKHLNQGHLVNFLIPLPSIEEQISFANFSIQIDKLKFTVQKSLEETQTLFNSLMQTYFG